jgi:sulfate adenylyltransferase subunit 2
MIELVGLLAHARSAAYARRVEEALRVIVDGLAMCSRPYLACSFGKDSAVLLHLAITGGVCPPVRWVTFEETRLLGNYDEVVQAWRDRFVFDLVETRVDTEILQEYDDRRAIPREYDGYLIGLRAEESAWRRRTLRRDGVLYRIQSGYTAGMLRIAPLAWWRDRDIAAYITANDLPQLDTYRLGLTRDVRTATAIGEDRDGIRARQLRQLRQVSPERYGRMIAAYPELTIYAD